MPDPRVALGLAFKRASAHIAKPMIAADIAKRVNFVCSNSENRACARLLLAALLAKVHKPKVDIRKPYTEIGDPDTYSGRTYDESYITEFVTEHDLPCNPTTAFLTPALRNRNQTLTPDVDLEGRPKKVYQKTLQLLSDVHDKKVSAGDLLAEVIRSLLLFRDATRQGMKSLFTELRISEPKDAIPLSAEAIVTLIQQHLSCPRSSRLPVLVVAAAYQAAEKHLGERICPLRGHTAADKQTGALGDLEITLKGDDGVITSYEMKTRRVAQGDINHALRKVRDRGKTIDNYIFITTEIIDQQVQDYAKALYEKTGGIEFVILDCIDFLHHFLHLFHRLRKQFLDAYQELLIKEPPSAVRQDLKEAFLALRRAAESGIYGDLDI